MSAELRALADLLALRTGVVTEDRRLSGLAVRLTTLMSERGIASVGALTATLKSCSDPGLLNAVIDAVLINETLFFRDRGPFEKFRTVMLDHLIAARAATRRLRIWSAACSTGQEPYSLAILLDEHARQFTGWQTEILGTDISRQSLATARAGVYSQFEVQRGLSTPHLLRYFQKRGSNWAINDHIRAGVAFAERNLLGDFSGLGTFDVIFCRNVLMYMEPEHRSRILDRFTRNLAPDGFLVMGAAETIVGLTSRFVPLAGHPSVFVQRQEPAKAA